ncbi:MAG: hypothetical protein HC907_07290 [Richelia sp. SM1_7_0]|nr:hypothetical protein [Richelia sp. SM1_7_0]
MTKLLKYIRDNLKILSVILYFILTAIIIVLMFPKQGKFRYDFQKGRPWIYGDLHAEFDFPIYKSMNIVTAERGFLCFRGFKPYFVLDEGITKNQIENFSKEFKRRWVEFSVNEFDIENEQAYNQRKNALLRKIENTFETRITDLLNSVYSTGIIDIEEAREETSSGLNQIMLVKSNVAEEKNISTLYTPRSAYEFLRLAINEIYQENISPEVKRYRSFFDSFDINRFIQVNVTYDEEKSASARNDLLNKISMFRDKVQKGQRIISSGELVTTEKYQILESLRVEYENRLGFVASQLISFGKFILVCVALFVIFLFLYNLRKEILYDNIKSLFYFIVGYFNYFRCFDNHKIESYKLLYHTFRYFTHYFTDFL